MADNSVEMEEEVAESFDIRAGDLFIYPDKIIGVSVLSVSAKTGSGVFFTVRLYSTVNDPVDVSESELRGFIAREGLEKLTTFRDQMEEVGKNMFLNEGDIFTQYGEFFLEVLTSEMLYIDTAGKQVLIIGVKDKGDLVAFRNAIEVKAMIYGNTDQFPPQGE